MITPTKLLYMDEMQLLESAAHVMDMFEENGKTVVVLDQTIFYPQGGGQPYDTGTIEGQNGTFRVDEVRFVEGIVKHIGTVERGVIDANDMVTCRVNPERRILHTRLHSGGHVLDMAVDALKLPWVPAKGYHFPDGPYIEYAGSLEGIDGEKLKTNLQHSCDTFISEGLQTSIRFMDKKDMGQWCRHVSVNLPEGKPGRIVLYGTFGVPCGGTHVANLADIKGITVRKIKMEKGVVRVSYDVAR